jgi:hypothetical protein
MREVWVFVRTSVLICHDLVESGVDVSEFIEGVKVCRELFRYSVQLVINPRWTGSHIEIIHLILKLRPKSFDPFCHRSCPSGG